MELPNLNLKYKNTTLILGAGASYGASCFENKKVAAPLDADFFRQVQKLDFSKKDKNIQDLLAFLRSEFDPSLRMPMEKFFTQVESLDDFYTTTRIHRGPKVQRYQGILNRYTATLADIFSRLQTIVGYSPPNPTPPLKCKYHEMLAERLRHGNNNYEPDVIISFNYDCLIDEALKAKAEKRWNAENGYGYSVSSGAHYWHTHTAPGPPATQSIQLLKLHGSLNWSRKVLQSGRPSKTLKLRQNPYETANRSRFEIVPPVWNKAIGTDTILTELWKKARQALADCKVMVVVGYSVPDTDLLSQSLIRVTASEKEDALSHLIVVNPDPSARYKFIDMLRGSLKKKSMVIELNTLKDFENQLVK